MAPKPVKDGRLLSSNFDKLRIDKQALQNLFSKLCIYSLFSLLPRLQVMKTEFVPKLVATATACCAIYLVLRVSAHLLTVKTLASVGYFDTLVSVNLTPVSSSHLSSANRALTQKTLSLPGQFFITDFISGLVHRPQI